MTARRCFSGSSWRRSRGSRWPSRSISRRRCGALCYPLLVASQTIPIPMLAPVLRAVARVRDHAEARRDRARLVLLRSSSTTLAGLAAVDPELIKLMRTFDAPRLRTFRHVELPAALPGLLHGRQDRRRRRGDRRGVRRAGRLELAASATCSSSPSPQLLMRARVRRGRDPVPVRNCTVRTAHAGRAARAAVGLRIQRRTLRMKRTVPARRARGARRRDPRRLRREEGRHLGAVRLGPAVHADARLGAERGPRRHLSRR